MKKPIIIFIIATILVLFITCPFVFGAWDNTKPADATDYDDGLGEIRDNWDALEVILGVDLIYVPVTNYIVNVKESTYGALGDNSNDDTEEIQAALDAAVAAKKAVYFPAGVYKVTAALTMASGSRVCLFGDGVGQTMIYQNTVDLNLFEIGDSSAFTKGWYIGHMQLATSDGTATAGGSGFAVVLTQMDNGMMEFVGISGAGAAAGSGGGVKQDACQTNLFNNVSSDHTLQDITGARNILTGCSAFYFDDTLSNVTNTTFLNCKITGAKHGYFDTGSACDSINIIGGNVTATSFGIFSVGSDGWSVRDAYFESGAGATYDGAINISLEDCQNFLLDGFKFTGNDNAETCIDLDSCLNFSIENTVTRGFVKIDSDCYYGSIESCEFADQTQLVNDSIALRLENNFITSTTAQQTQRTYGCITRNHQIDNGVGSFETWSAATQPDGWVKVDTPTIVQEMTIVHSGSISCKITAAGSATEGLFFRMPDDFKNVWVSIEFWIYPHTLGGTAPMVCMGNTEPSGAERIRTSNTTGAWSKFEGSFYKDTGQTENIYIISATDGDVFYVDDVKIWAEFNPYGSAIPLTDEGATPDVYNPGGPDVFIIEQSGATDVTDFDAFGSTGGLYDGQEITIIGNDATHVSTLKDGVPMNLTGANDFALTNVGDTVKLVYFQGIWYGVSESTNN